MSHFTVLVIGANPLEQLAPYHEFECTGIDDKYVVEVDVTEECRKHISDGDISDGLGWFGLEDKIVDDETKVNRADEHMYGFAIVVDGKLVKAVDRTNPNKKWDWYQLGGRWTGFFKLKPGAKGVLGKEGLMTPRAERGTADAAYKKDIDWEGMAAEAATKARVIHRGVQAKIAGLPKPRTWDEIRAAHGAENPRDATFQKGIDAAREEYNAQPAVAAFREDHNFFFEKVEDYLGSEDDYAAAAARRRCQTFAVVKDGQWFESGAMGWWGMVADEKDPEAWGREFEALISGLAPDTLLAVYDCHI